MLEVSGLSAGYEGNDVVQDIALHIDPGEAVMIIGSNGAGKTTLFRSVIGLIAPSSGEVRFQGEDITGVPAQRVVRRGISFVPAERHLFPRMTVLENLSLGAYPKRPDPETMTLVMDLFPRLDERRKQIAGTMSGGEQQMLAVGRALVSGRKMMLLDEPSMGLAPLLMMDVFKVMTEINEKGTTILLVEQNARMALQFAQRGYVLESGNLVLEGDSKDLLDDPEVKKAYLGG